MTDAAEKSWGFPPWDDARWASLSDADNAGEILEAGERRFLENYRPRRADLAAERSLRLALRDLGTEEMEVLPDERGEDELVTGTLEVFFDEDADTRATRTDADDQGRWSQRAVEAPVDRQPAHASWWRYGAIGGGVVAVAAAALLTLRPAAPPEGDAGTERVPTATVTEASPASVSWSMKSGSLAGDMVIEEDTRRTATFRTGDDGACLETDDGSEACLRAGSSAKIDDGVLDVIEGAAEVEAAQVAYISLQAAGMRVEASDGKVTIEMDSADTWRIMVHDGEVAVYDLEGKVAQLRAGDALARGGMMLARDQRDDADADADIDADIDAGGDPETLASEVAGAGEKAGSPRAKRAGRDSSKGIEGGPTASEMLAEARKLRAAGELDEAAKAYEALLARHPGASASKTATVALGQLYLGPLDRPKSALRAFDRYIKGGGKTLAEEARYGKIRALKKLGRDGQADAETAKFIAAYPNSSYAKALQR